MIGFLSVQLNDDDKNFMLDLYKNYYSLVWKTIFSITHSTEDIEDLINDVFIKLIEKISLIRSFDCPKMTCYVVYTTRSVSINYIKHKKVETKHIYYIENTDVTKGLDNNENESEARLIRQEEIELLADAITKLPQGQKDLLYFKYMLDMSDQDIAQILGIAPNSVRQYLTRARRNAKSLMERGVCNDVE
ncbi:RNA polymerase subunit sigma-54 [Clostridium thermosuccinogenes]|uniref:RNA polymerase subunit sigma-54 n=1 Tax=Clostridium thermosuccinogenes TaxID=84032 RepID=A0A2K2F7B9_9CLOT|nr:sigma-70 family RNA polymerase sigma factor [Pseudoclostridium thermosuccinogenes]AUS98014.1 RNA polymerase subunit sigma-54 [Pseudoclostridium thermosuccinogenes]PNT91890.1 RNA polymerase subunit sigma-54 [Pseudoclostridium thermosuccinogenes]PNT94305.1 RNA polymerase subunit sigma-54 [Pseudoclostridium thermosuccinogenes]PNT94677.1 RNA polymerase subunit sigma-54 [Pseudoclostridium thermosuccinogenes]